MKKKIYKNTCKQAAPRFCQQNYCGKCILGFICQELSDNLSFFFFNEKRLSLLTSQKVIGKIQVKSILFFSTDEKERFDPTQFQESIVQGLNQTGTDLDAVAKFLDVSGAKLDYRRYAETLFDILVAGGMLGE